MGTSQNHGGSKPKSKLVPAHADALPSKPLPEAIQDRFRGFRVSMGQYVKSGSRRYRETALGRYVREASGGSGVGYRKFGAAARSGAAAISALSSLGQGGTGQTEAGQSLRGAIGQPIDVAAQIIAEAIAPNDENRDRIITALEEAICQALEGEDSLVAGDITDDLLASILLAYITEVVFLDVWLEAGNSTASAATHTQLVARENDLRQIVRAAVDVQLSAKIGQGLSSMSRRELQRLQLDVIREVLASWEGLGQ